MISNIQRKVFKISTDRLVNSRWDLTVSEHRAFILEELIKLFDEQTFRLIEQILEKSNYNTLDYLLVVSIDKKSHCKRLFSKKGIKVNGNTFKRFVGTTAGLKNNCVLFVNEKILDELNEKCDCGRNKEVPIIPAKFEAYKSLTCSASVPIPNPAKILVVSDCLIKYKSNVITICDGDEDGQPIVKQENNLELENNISDGYNLCTPEYMQQIAEFLKLDYIPSGVCLRNAWLKGMLFPFDITEFAQMYGKSFIVKDVWGNSHDIREVDMILTESSLKLWKAYDSIEDYIECYKKYGYNFAITKISPQQLEDYRPVNYQYLQSYQLSDEDIKELCQPTIDWLKKSLCGDYQSTLDFLGINEKTNNLDFTQALYLDQRFLQDPYVIDRVKRLIAKKIDEAKVGKLICQGNYQILSGDPVCLMQHILGLEVTGLLKAGQAYSNYWNEHKVNSVVAFRSPMTSHNNIRKVDLVSNAECNKWYRHMKNIFIINGFDTFCMATNGSDFDYYIVPLSGNIKSAVGELANARCVFNVK